MLASTIKLYRYFTSFLFSTFLTNYAGHPNISLTFQNGNIIEGSVYVLHDSHHVITCTAEGLGITKTSLETRSMFTLLEKSRDDTNIVSNEVTSNGSRVIINLQAIAVLTLIECNVFGDFSVLTVSHAEVLTVGKLFTCMLNVFCLVCKTTAYHI